MKPSLKISDLDFYPIAPNRGLIGFINFVLNDALMINGVAVYRRKDHSGIRLVFPERNLSNGKSIVLIRPISVGVTNYITRIVSDFLDETLVRKNYERQEY